MNHDARLMSGILLIIVPTIQYGVHFLLRLHAALGPGFAWLVRIGVPLAAILIPDGLFLSVAFTPDRPNQWIWSSYGGALLLAIGVVVRGVGLIRA